MLTADEKARRIAEMSPAEIIAEELKQTAELADLILAAIEDHGRGAEVPMLNAIFAALLQTETVMLATLDRNTRRQVMKGAEAARPKMLARALAQNYPQVQTVRKARFDA